MILPAAFFSSLLRDKVWASSRATDVFLMDNSLVWEGELAHLSDPDERTLLLLATQVFRVRFGAHWPADAIEA